jgi:flagellar basal body-associated protein FliL
MKNNKFNTIFWVGLIPVIVIAFVVIVIIFGMLYADFRAKPDRYSISVTHEEKVDPPKPEKIYIHDTVYVNVPQPCRREHVSSENKRVAIEPKPIKDDKDTSNANHSIN